MLPTRTSLLRALVLTTVLAGSLVSLPHADAAGGSARRITAGPQTDTFTYTGTAQTWVVPAGVTQATFVVNGAEGNTSIKAAGKGGQATDTLFVTPGQTIDVVVGGTSTGSTGGFNGGGDGSGSGGGGASDVRVGGTTLSDRVLVAGGGGGGGGCTDKNGAGTTGGDGGGTSGADAPYVPDCNTGFGGVNGTGGTPTTGGTDSAAPTYDGSFGVGGSAAQEQYNTGGGGGGWYGGAAGFHGAGGGGGSGVGPAGTIFATGVRSGDGLVTVSYNVPSYTLTVSTSGRGRVSSTPAGIDCSTATKSHPACSADYAAGTLVTLKATPAENQISFNGWGGDCKGSSTCTVTLDQARSVTASFVKEAPPVLTDVAITPPTFTQTSGTPTVSWTVSEAVDLRVRVVRRQLQPTCGDGLCRGGHPQPGARSTTFHTAAGSGHYVLAGKLAPGELHPGRYRLVVTATNSAGDAVHATRFFRVAGRA